MSMKKKKDKDKENEKGAITKKVHTKKLKMMGRAKSIYDFQKKWIGTGKGIQKSGGEVKGKGKCKSKKGRARQREEHDIIIISNRQFKTKKIK